jgi:endonuclease YncB( thermonuclease family)
MCADAFASGVLTLRPGQYKSPDVGIFQLDGSKIRLAHIQPVMRNQHCRRAGRTYPCGFYGWQYWSLLIDGRGVECRPTGETERFVCGIVGGDVADIGLWLIEQGFAHAEPSAPASYRIAESGSMKSRKGIFSEP